VREVLERARREPLEWGENGEEAKSVFNGK